MRFSFRQLVDRIQVSYWFVPLAVGLLAVLVAHILLWVDNLIPNSVLDTGKYVFGGSPEQTRTAMLGIVGVTVSTAGIVFSLLTVPFSVVASQFGSRLLRIYMRDSTFQAVLGVFMGTIAYCLAVALAIPAAEVESETPQIASTVGLLLALATVASLIVLIHHIGKSLQAPNLVASAGSELRDVVLSAAQHTKRRGDVDDKAAVKALQAQIEQEGSPIYAIETGYIQAIEAEGVLDLATENDLVIQFTRKPGHFVQPGVLIARTWTRDGAVNDQVINRIRETYLLGNLRTPIQDVEYAVMQLAEVAVRAMSPAINDPYTAATCLHHIGAGLALRVAQSEPPCCFHDREGRVRLVFEPATIGELLVAAFGILRPASRDNAQVLLAILACIEQIAHHTPQTEVRAELLQQVRLVEAESQASTSIGWDQERVCQRCMELASRLG